MRTLTITEIQDGDFVATTADHFSGVLCFDEALAVTAKWMLTAKTDGLKVPYMTKMESFWEMKRRIEEEILAKLRPADRLLIEEAMKRHDPR